jgi:Tol biopolymer transport system component
LEAYVNSLLSSPVTTGLISSPTYDEFSPYWLEDESGLVFAREETTGYNIYKVSFDDGSVTQLTDTTGNDIMPAAKR